MANFFTHFSCHFDLLTSAQAERSLDIYRTMSVELESKGAVIGFVASIDIEPDTTRLWIRDEDYGDPEHVIAFVKRCARTFKLEGPWGFQWADTCSSARLNAFGGGAHVIDLATGEMVDWNDTRTWLEIVLAGGDPYA